MTVLLVLCEANLLMSDGFSSQMTSNKKKHPDMCCFKLRPERRMHASVNNTIIVSNNGLSPVRRQAIIWTNAGLWLTGHLETIFSEILMKLQQFSFTRTHLKMSSATYRPFHLGFNVLTCKRLRTSVASADHTHTLLKTYHVSPFVYSYILDSCDWHYRNLNGNWKQSPTTSP